MPRFNFTFDDPSPVIVYNGAWTGSITKDTSSYANGTHTSTTSSGADATIQFSGTAAYIFGSKGADRGDYTVTVDGTSQSASGKADGLQYNQVLFQTGDLSNGAHTVKISNTGGATLDLDYVVVTTGDGKDDGMLELVDLEEDAARNISYSNSATWTINTDANNNYHKDPNSNNPAATRVTGVQGDYATIGFFGQSITLYGCLINNHGDYTVSLDSGNPVRLNGNRTSATCRQALWSASGLTPGSHTVQLTNAASAVLGLDYVTVGRWSTGDSTSSGTNPSASSPSKTSSPKNNTAAIAGGAGAGAAIAVILIAVGIFLCLRRRRGKSTSGRRQSILMDKDDIHGQQPHPPVNRAPFMGQHQGQVLSNPQQHDGAHMVDAPPPHYDVATHEERSTAGGSSDIVSPTQSRPPVLTGKRALMARQ